MKLEFTNDIVQKQKLLITQNMQLSFKLLEMSSAELLDYINKELQENPVLEIENGSTEEYDKLKADESGYYNGERVNDSNLNIFNFISSPITLKENLLEQIDTMALEDKILRICRYIVENLDERGYVTESVEDISKILSTSVDNVDKSLKVVQSLEPYGIGARNLSECLGIQLREKGYKDKNLFTIVNKYIDFAAGNKYKKLTSILNVDADKVKEYINIIKSLEPKPARGYYTGESTVYTVPEAYIKKVDGENKILLNAEAFPKLKINDSYVEIMKNSKETSDFIKDKLSSTASLIKYVDKRKATVYKVIEKILKIQKDYFDFKGASLKPMTLKEMAESLNLHESTVSRAVKDKYIMTEIGPMKLKDFFTGSYSTSEGFMSTVDVKKKISEIVDLENKRKPLSDEKISKTLLKNFNISISRRTVAKYREEIGIKSSSERRAY